jgi:GNAT superfamily N-acetyltransferase
MTFPHPKTKIKKVHRLVVLPDYQGIGIGNRLLNYTARIMQSKTELVSITTSVKGFAKSLQKNNEWSLMRAGRVGRPGKTSKCKASSMNRNTYSFAYIGGV